MRIKDVLGALKVRDIMRTDYISLNPSISITGAVKNGFTQCDHSAFPVESEARIAGLITIAAIRKVPRSRWNDTRIADVMDEISKNNSLHLEEKAVSALTKMVKTRLDLLPVVEGGTCKGVLTQDDLLRTIADHEENGQSMPG